MPHFADMVYQLGGLPVMAGIPYSQDAKYYFVDAANGSDSNDGLSLDHALATIIAAEDKCVANHHDTVFYIAGSSSVTMTAALTWDKSYTHLIGICAPSAFSQRARIFQLSTLTNASPLLNITASGCIFKNFYIFQGVNDAGSLINVGVTGGRNYFENVHFAGGGHATCAIDASASLSLSGSENMFNHCTIGVETANHATGATGLLFGGTNATRNVFDDCIFQTWAVNKNVFHVEVTGVTSIQRYNYFRRCLFLNQNHSYSIDTVFELVGGDTTTGFFILIDCFSHGADDWDDRDSGKVIAGMDVLTSGGASGQLLATTVT